MTNSTGMVFHALFRAHHSSALAKLASHGLGDIGSPRLLLELRRCREQGSTPSQRELADLLHVTPATIATSLKSLERNGYVQRHTDPADSRRNLISITRKGLDALMDSHRIFLGIDQAMLSGFSEEEVGQMNQYLLRMLKNLYAIGGRQDNSRSTPCERMDRLL